MGVNLNYFMPLLAAGAVAAAIAVAPVAAAAPNQGAVSAGGSSGDSNQGQQSCMNLGGTQSQCQSPGNAQVYDAPPQVDYFPYAGGAT